MTLGSILGRLEDNAFVEETLAGLDDIVLLTRLRTAAESAGEPLSEFAAALVGRFVQGAGDEAWLSLIATASRAHDPAAAGLHYMLSAGLALEARSHHHGRAPETGAS
jgi:hypothetical protein